MPFKISDAAKADIDEIVESIKIDNPIAAEKWLRVLIEKCEALGSFPSMGRIREDLLPGAYMFPYANYLIFYRIMGDTVVIAHVVHAARDVRNLPL